MTGLRRALARLRPERGYSLVESVTVMALLGTVLATLTGLFVSGTRSQLDLNERMQAQNNAVVGLSRLRRDVQCASAATVGGGGASVTLTVPAACAATGSVQWCTAASSSPGRFTLRRRETGGTCGATDAQMADFLTVGTPFTTATSTETTLAKLRANILVQHPNAATPYRLCSILVLRNSQFVAPPGAPTTVAPC